MLSLYDALTFSIKKRHLLEGICFAIFLFGCFILSCFVFDKNFSIIEIIKLGLGVSPDNKAKQIASLLSLYPKTFGISFLFFIISFMFFSQSLIVSKKVLFNLPPHFTLSFFMANLIKFAILFTPPLIVLYIYLQDVLPPLFLFGANKAINLPARLSYPYSILTTCMLVGWSIFYLYYAICLFLEKFSFVQLFKVFCFFRHIKTVFELLVAHIIMLLLLLMAWTVLFLIGSHLDSITVCFATIAAYLLIMIISQNARFVFIIPIAVAGIIIASINYFSGQPFPVRFLPLTITGVISFHMLFVLWFMFLAAIAHLFSQTTFVFHFNKTPSSDVKDADPDKLRRMEEIYDDYLKESHSEEQDNFFNHV